MPDTVKGQKLHAMKTTIQFIFLGIIFSCLSSCNKKEVESVFPSVTTVSAKSTASKTIIFTGKLSWKNPGQINEMGFIWQINDDPKEKPGFIITPETGLKTGTFQAEVANSLKKGSKYIVRAYALCGNQEVYGEKMEFIPEADLPLKLSTFIKTEAYSLDTIVISGKLFNNSPDYTRVKFDTTTANIITVNDSVIQCIVPETLESNLSTIKVITNGIENTFSQKFTHKESSITSIASQVKYGNLLTINGHFVPSKVISVTITGNNTSYTLAPFSVTKNSIKVAIYNQQNPYELLNFASFKVGVAIPGKILNWDNSVFFESSWTKLADLPGSTRYKSSAFTLRRKYLYRRRSIKWHSSK